MNSLFGVALSLCVAAFGMQAHAGTDALSQIKSAGVIGTHKHRGRLVMMCLEGSLRYLEHQWVAHAGDFFLEVPGESPTLVRENPAGCRLLGWMRGAIEFYDENANFVETADVWWFINHYESYCREHGLEINPQLYI